MKYKMTYYDGSGLEYKGGTWKVKKTPKTVMFELIEEPYFSQDCPDKMRLPLSNKGEHCLRDWGDGTYTVYPYRSGVPHVFEPLEVGR